jgi:hypothetical protein
MLVKGNHGSRSIPNDFGIYDFIIVCGYEKKGRHGYLMSIKTNILIVRPVSHQHRIAVNTGIDACLNGGVVGGDIDDSGYCCGTEYGHR